MENIHQSRECYRSKYNEEHFLIRSNKEVEKVNYQFTDFLSLTKNKSYIAISGCVLEHIITNKELSNNEKLYYIVADSLALINANYGKNRSIALSGEGWANRLDCTRSQIFSMQKSLEKKGFFIIHKDKNNIGQNKRNIIIPTLPQEIFDNICKNSENIIGERVGVESYYSNLNESVRTYLDRTKLFIKLNYDLVSHFTSNKDLSSFQKIMWLDFYIKSYKKNIVLDRLIYEDKENNHYIPNGSNFFLNVSYEELANRYFCSKKHICKSINILRNLGFIKREQFYIKHPDHNNENDRQDKSLYKITMSLPSNFGFELENIKNRSNVKMNSVNEYNENVIVDGEKKKISYFNDEIKDNEEFKINRSETSLIETHIKSDLENGGAFSDPPFSKFRPLLNKYIKTNINILDIEKKSKNFDKNRNFKKLIEYLPLSISDLAFLTEQSGYNIKFIEKLAYKISKNYPDRNFYSKKELIKYLIIVLHHEKKKIGEVSGRKFRAYIKDDKEKMISLNDVLPLSENILKEISRRIDFKYSNHFSNKLAKHIDHKYPDLKFQSEKSLINYMVKALDNEMRKPQDVNRDNFIFRWELEEIEKYEILAQKEKIEQDGIIEKFRINNIKDKNQRKDKIEFEESYNKISNKIRFNFYNLSDEEIHLLENQKQEGAIQIGNIMGRILN